MFSDMLGDTMEPYVDDMLVKSRLGVDHGLDMERAFARMKLHNVRLNPPKCAFGVNSGKLIGFMASQRGLRSIQKSSMTIYLNII